jgi:uncharacterized protein YggE
MFSKTFTIYCAIGLLTCGFARVARGEGSEGAITGTGSATIARQPNLLRMQIALNAEGKDMKEALAKLRATEAAARKKLLDLGASGPSVLLSDIRDGSVKSQREMQMEMIMMRQQGRAGKKPTTAQAKVVKLAATLKAEWPLNGGGDELLTNSWSLVEKIKSADVGGKKNAPALSPEQQEEQEEQQAMAEQMGDPSQPADPREPQFVYVARLSEDEQARAAAEAFAGAKAEAAHLAKAAGADLGALRQLSSQVAPAKNEDNENPYYAYLANAMGGARTNPSISEAVGPQASEVSMRVVVTAAFAVK